MNNVIDSQNKDNILQIINDRQLHLRYFTYILKSLPVKAEELHSQRLLILYFAIVGSDLLAAEWINNNNNNNNSESNKYKNDLFEELKLCYNKNTGGFHSEPLITYSTCATLPMTHCALHVLNTCSLLPKAFTSWLCKEKVLSFILSCQVKNDCYPFGISYKGAFQAAPMITEVDLRFTYSALMGMSLLYSPTPLSEISELQIPLNNAIEFIWRCWNAYDGGFTAVPEATESHGGMTFCAVASLILSGILFSSINSHRRKAIIRYCISRIAIGPIDDISLGVNKNFKTSSPPTHSILGYQGRTQKDCDTCYVHWIGSTLSMLLENYEEEILINTSPIVNFILACTDNRHGGFGKFIGVTSDPVHACLGLSGLLQHIKNINTDLLRVPHPVYGCSWEIVRQTGLPELIKQKK